MPEARPTTTGPTTTLKFTYEKGNNFRVIHVDGAQGVLSPTGSHVIISFFNERVPIPKTSYLEINAKGEVVSDPKHEAREGIFREVEVAAVMDLEVAVQLHDWLRTNIPIWKALKQQNAVSSTHPTSG